MQDPLGPAPLFCVRLLQPVALRLRLLTLPLHAHEVVAAFSLYMFIFLIISPVLSQLLVPGIYSRLSRRTRTAWDIRVLSTVQATAICALAIYVITVNDQRRRLHWEGRLFGYSGASSMV